MQEMIDNGEWDVKRRDVLQCFNGQRCGGKIGDSTRICGKPRCVIALHKQHGLAAPGWYITVGSKSVWAKPVLPLGSDGGPILSGGAALLTRVDKPVRLTKGQWRVAIESWLDAEDQVLTIDSGESGSVILPSVDLSELPTSHEVDEEEEPDDDDDGGDDGNGDDNLDYDLDGLDDPHLAPVPVLDNLARNPRVRRVAQLGHDLGEGAIEVLQRLSREVRSLKDRDFEQEAQLVRLQEDRDGLAASVERARLQTRSLEQRLDVVRTSVSPVIQRIQKVVHGLLQVQTSAAVDSLTFEIFDAQGTLPRMKQQISELNDKFDSGGGITCHGVTFGSKTEFLRWYKLKGIVNHAMFMDAVAVLHSISDAVVSDEQYNKTRESQTKNAFDNSLESTMASSFNTLVPAGLIGGRQVKEGGAATAQLKKCMATFDVWEPPGMEQGLSHEIVAGITLVNDKVLKYQGNSMRDPEIRLLAQGLLGDSVNFCRELLLFISVQNKHLTQGTHYTPAQVWSMQLDILLQILHELSQIRRGLATSARKEPALYAWGMLQARAVQERLRTNKFENDPLLNGIIMRKIMLQGSNDALKVKIKKIDEITKKVANYHRISNSDIKALQDKVAKLEKK
jgi:hypothetical protein